MLTKFKKAFVALFLPSAWDAPTILDYLLVRLPFLNGGGAWVIGEYFTPYVDPLGLFVAVLLSFAATGLGLLAFKLLLFVRDPEFKLKFIRPVVDVGRDYVRIGVEVRNDATFPVEVCIERLDTTCAETVNSWQKLESNVFILPPGETTNYIGAMINLDGKMKPYLPATLVFRLSYGLKGNRRHKIGRDYNLSVQTTPPFIHQWFVRETNPDSTTLTL